MAGNPEKGEVRFHALGRDLLLRFDTNAICELEDELDRPISEIAAQLQTAPRLSMIRAVFRAGLVGEISTEEAGEIIDELGAPEVVILMGKAFGLSSPARRPRPTKLPPPKRDSIGRAS